MMPEQSKSDSKRVDNLRPILLIAGFFLLGLALAFLLFGDQVLSRREATNVEDGLPQLTLSERISSGEVPIPADGAPLNVGDPAHQFSLPDLNGNTVSLEDFRGQPVIVNFWATWCPPCRIEMPEFEQVYGRHKDKGLVILAVNEGEEAEDVRSFFYEEMGFTYTPLLDSESEVGELYGAVGLPTTFFIDAAGEVAAVHRGALTIAQLERYLEEIMP